MTKAFGSKGMNIVYDTLPQKKFFEKPSEFSDLDHRESAQISEFEVRKIAKAFKENGLYLETYDVYDIFGGTPRYPMVDADLPQETTFLIQFPKDREYLVDTTGATQYVRMWLKVV